MNEIEALRTVITILTANLALLEKKPVNAYTPAFDTNEAERKRLEGIVNSMKPHEWRGWGNGNPLPEHVGDNEKPDDDFLRAFGPMMEAAKREEFKDTKGEVFFYPRIKSRTPGEGWMGVKREALRMVLSEWGQKWMNDAANIAYGNVPRTAAVALLMRQVNEA